MRRWTSILAVATTVAVGCTAAAPGADAPPTNGTSSIATQEPGTPATNGTGGATTLSVDTVPTTPGTQDPSATGTIIMIKLPVGDVSQAEAFYGVVFGAKPVAAMGDGVHIVTLPGQGPGLVLLRTDAAADQHGAFIMKVPDLQVAKAAALAHGATEQGTFAGTPGGQNAKSVDLLDPWGNQIEILQLG